ncbi:TRAPP trafficking subunit Trs65-domain-containing protein [Mycena capillaripes]|nr:TRAPP trafficking subunit Trs65-domain-containing protein [Mycena capillaripes]
MSALEQLFASAELDVVVPDTSLEYPPATPADDWLSRLKSETLERTQAFFDEQLQALLTVRIDQPSTSNSRDAAHPPKDVLSFLSHLQISLEATYISSVPVGPSAPDTPRTARLSAPPRTASLAAKLNARSAHPPIFPPNTPNPTPSSAETDKRYLKSEGTLLLASIWGQNASDDSQEAFTLLWSEEEEMWVAVYRLALTVAFLRLAVSDPLLCLTVSATLRDRPQTLSRPNHPLALFLASVDFLPAATAPASPTSPTATNGIPGADAPPTEPMLSGLPEINLLEGLGAGPSFAPAALGLPTARLGSVSRLKLFTLQPLAPRTPPPAPSPSPLTAIGRSQSQLSASGPGPATLRKSFRKTLPTVSGFRVRMRTVFVPSVLLPLTETQTTDEEAETDEERDRLEAGTDERTVVLCVELENSGESGRTVGFEVEKVDVKIGGNDDAGARAVLVGWGNVGGKDSGSVFPMRVGASEQYNLLYAVSFLRSPDEALAMGLIKDSGAQEMSQRAVTICIFGRPYLASSPSSSFPPTTPTAASSSSPSYPTRTFCSKWNCVLDLSSQPHPEPEDDPQDGDVQLQIPSVLPEPASPFPSTPRVRSDSLINLLSPPPSTTPLSATPVKRHTLPGGQAIVAARALGLKSVGTGQGYRASTSMLNPLNNANKERDAPPHPPRSSSYNNNQYTPPSVSALAHTLPRSPTTYQAPRLSVDPDYQPPIPMTPAYPSYPTRSAMPPTPPAVMAHSHSQGGVGGGMVGRSVEIRRERGMAMGTGAMGVPPTPGPVVSVGGGGGGFYGLGSSASASDLAIHREEDEYEYEHEHEHETDGGQHAPVRTGEAIVVSVGLVASGVRRVGENLGKTLDGTRGGDELHRIYPLDHFTLDVFVFNQSEWTRRFEVSCPDRRRGRARNPGEKAPSPGIVPLDNRVRIGPLLPAACQSVRMEFLAVTPGVHSITTLTLTDVESGYSMNLRSVMDIVVHDIGDV